MYKATAASDVPCLVYEITCLITGKSYIGITIKTIDKRWSEHCKEARAKRFETVFYRSLRKYGPESFSIKLLYEAVNGREAQKVERALIAERNTLAPSGMNSSTGGESHAGRAMTAEVKEKIRQKKIGTKLSAEARAKMSASRIGKTHTKETRQKMREVQARPDVKAKQKAGMSTPDFIAKQRENGSRVMTALWSDPAFRARSKERSNNGIAYQKARKALRLATMPRGRTKSEAMIDRWKNPEYRASMLEKMSRPSEKRRAAIVAANKSRAGTRADRTKFGKRTACVRALMRKLPTQIFPREINYVV